jgi:hypothetical protein
MSPTIVGERNAFVIAPQCLQDTWYRDREKMLNIHCDREGDVWHVLIIPIYELRVALN